MAVDACYSVTFDPTWQSKNDPKFQRVGEYNDMGKLLANHEKYQNRIFFTSDAKEDIVPGQSNFARKFLEGLIHYRKNNELVTAYELYGSFVKKASPTPRANYFEGDEAQSSFLFFVNKPEFDSQNAQVREADLKHWEEADNKATIEGYQQYLNIHPDGIFAPQARRTMYEIADRNEWKIAEITNTSDAYRNYLKRYPDGKYIKAAKQKVVEMDLADPTIPKVDSNKLIDEEGEVTDRQGNKYPYQKMKDGRVWIGKNLNIEIANSYCYEDNAIYCENFGRLYTFESATEGCLELGDEWRLPTGDEWRGLIKYYSITKTEGKKREQGTYYSALFEGKQSDFNVRLGGFRNHYENFSSIGQQAFFWAQSYGAEGQSFLFNKNGLRNYMADDRNELGLSVRCIRND